jgi:CheY-like chemotaxis protein
MLVEDDPTMRSLLKTLLELEKFQVIAQSDLQENNILTLVLEEQPDVLIMDVNLRNTNGINVLQQLRSAESTPTIKVLMVSGQDLQQECLNAGANGFLLKPYMPSDLIQWIRTQTA